MRRAMLLLSGGAAAGLVLARRRRATPDHDPHPDRAWWRAPDAPAPTLCTDYTISAQYVKVRDGVRLAVDVWLPAGLPPDAQLPTVLLSTRYHRRRRWRNAAVARVAHRLRLDPREVEAQRYLGAGYAFVAYDARGTGASFGSRMGEPGPEEIADGADVCDWIVAQPWSDGRVGSTGVSYEGTTAEMLLTNNHPAVRGAVVRFANFDPLIDVILVGGVRQSWFLEDWSGMNVELDNDRAEAYYARVGGGFIKLLARLTNGVARVDGDSDDTLLRQAIAEHAANVTASSTVTDLIWRDGVDLAEIARLAGLTDFDPDADLPDPTAAGNVDKLATGGAIYSYAGWYDSGYGWAALKCFKALEHAGARVIMGPWDHGGRQVPDPTTPVWKTSFDHHGELLRFLDHVVKGEPNSIADEEPVRYYTVGDGWHSAPTWPPPDVVGTPLYCAAGGTLRGTPPAGEGADRYRVDPTHSSGTANRWRSIFNLRQERIAWPDRAEQDRKLLVFQTDALPEPLEITGHPVAVLFVRSSADDGSFHVYLEEVTAEGEVRYITEGIFRARHRRIGEDPPAWETLAPYHTFRKADDLPLVPGEVAELAFGMQPISYLVSAGSRVRVAIGGADADNFVMVPAQPPTIEILRSAEHPSHVVLPVPSRSVALLERA